MHIAVQHIQPFRERLLGKVHTTILKGIVGGFEIWKNGTRGHRCMFANAKGKQQ